MTLSFKIVIYFQSSPSGALGRRWLIRLYEHGRKDWVGDLWAQIREQESARYDGDPQMVVVGWEWVGETRRKT